MMIDRRFARDMYEETASAERCDMVLHRAFRATHRSNMHVFDRTTTKTQNPSCGVKSKVSCETCWNNTIRKRSSVCCGSHLNVYLSLSLSLYVYIYIYIRTYMCIYIYIYTHGDIYIYVYVYVYVCTHLYIYIYICMCVWIICLTCSIIRWNIPGTSWNKSSLAWLNTCACVCVYIYIYIYHMCICIYVYILRHVLVLWHFMCYFIVDH